MVDLQRDAFLPPAGRRRRRTFNAMWLLVLMSTIFAVFAIVQALR